MIAALSHPFINGITDCNAMLTTTSTTQKTTKISCLEMAPRPADSFRTIS